MNLFSFISQIFEPARKLIDDVHTSEEEKIKARAALEKVQNEVSFKIIDAERELLQSKTQIITAEARGESWMQRNWRPITMLTFLVLVVCDSFGLLTFRLSNEAWTLLKIGLGGYVVGRSAEKGIKEWKKK